MSDCGVLVALPMCMKVFSCIVARSVDCPGRPPMSWGWRNVLVCWTSCFLKKLWMRLGMWSVRTMLRKELALCEGRLGLGSQIRMEFFHCIGSC